ncbi:hypothetical protein Aazo_4045 ['Nostoc azollae' 0708]|jgi:hypothetical protein|uniref:Uncharacterized protein n=1 Tax=Nostoc azollae (strain 0708) TaxID=551115 RepID=D7E5E8_NOSA0|nr:hypothetical protein Aazo_4045 ['Nostoc azollae' 0708]
MLKTNAVAELLLTSYHDIETFDHTGSYKNCYIKLCKQFITKYIYHLLASLTF